MLCVLRDARLQNSPYFWAVYKSGTGTRGQGHWDARVGTWDLGTRGEGRGDIKHGTRGRMGRGRDGDAGTSNIGTRGTWGR